MLNGTRGMERTWTMPDLVACEGLEGNAVAKSSSRDKVVSARTRLTRLEAFSVRNIQVKLDVQTSVKLSVTTVLPAAFIGEVAEKTIIVWTMKQREIGPDYSFRDGTTARWPKTATAIEMGGDRVPLETNTCWFSLDVSSCIFLFECATHFDLGNMVPCFGDRRECVYS